MIPATLDQYEMFHKSKQTGCLAYRLSAAITFFLICPATCLALDDTANDVVSLMKTHCVRCHGLSEKIEGDVNLQSIHEIKELAAQPELLNRIITAVDTGIMPPDDGPDRNRQWRGRFVADLQELLKAASQLQGAQRTPLRRMNRFQYNNAVRDLLELKVEVFPLPERLMRDLDGYFQPQSGKMPSRVKVASRPLSKDNVTEPHLGGVTPFPQDLRAEHGFDNRGDHLTMSPMLTESFFGLSQSIVESNDFTSKNVGIWQDFFVAPNPNSPVVSDDQLRQRLQPFLTRAFRRPVDAETLARYVAFAQHRLQTGSPFANVMKAVVSAVICSPRFLYLSDGEPLQESEPLDEFHLASRLSFFLWGSIPDRELLQVAAEGKLGREHNLRAQVRRMLRDEKLRRFCDSFPSQWLQLERIISSEPDPDLFPKFYFAKYRASMHMMLEPLLVFETVLIENRSIMQLIDSDFSYRSDLLDAWYRDGTQGNPGAPTQVLLKRVPVSDRRQGGVITSAAVLTMTSGTVRTKPVTRGVWLATVILHEPPPPPPGNVPPLPDKPGADEANMTLRERFAAHRDAPACSACHQRIDPLGFALENYDAVGKWRDCYENGREVDASGRLLGKHQFNNIVEFKDALLAERERFARAFSKHLMAFALGRAITVADTLALDIIVSEAAANDFRLQTIIEQTVLSNSFKY